MNSTDVLVAFIAGVGLADCHMIDQDADDRRSPVDEIGTTDTVVGAVSVPRPTSLIRDANVLAIDPAASFFSDEDRRNHARIMIGGFLHRFVSVDILPPAGQFAAEANSLTAVLENLSPLASTWVDCARQIETALAALPVISADVADGLSSVTRAVTADKERLEKMTLDIQAASSRIEVARSACTTNSAEARDLFQRL
ncbi:hypothetical protein L8N14_024445, partial [Serratia marcescens]|nr:hypothetical protein [Serratia marcescens]